MAVNFYTDKPKGLLAKFKAAVTQTEAKGKITTWMLSDDEKYYTHKAAEWTKKAWLKPKTSDGILTFNMIKPQASKVSATTYAYYHGHLIETFLNHFDHDFETGEATALAASGDNCG